MSTADSDRTLGVILQLLILYDNRLKTQMLINQLLIFFVFWLKMFNQDTFTVSEAAAPDTAESPKILF